MRISAKADYAVRAAVELASAEGPVKGDHISQSQQIPLKFLENILIEMRHAGLVRSQRGRVPAAVAPRGAAVTTPRRGP